MQKRQTSKMKWLVTLRDGETVEVEEQVMRVDPLGNLYFHYAFLEPDADIATHIFHKDIWLKAIPVSEDDDEDPYNASW